MSKDLNGARSCASKVIHFQDSHIRVGSWLVFALPLQTGCPPGCMIVFMTRWLTSTEAEVMQENKAKAAMHFMMELQELHTITSVTFCWSHRPILIQHRQGHEHQEVRT